MRKKKYSLRDDINLLDVMLTDSKKQSPLYHPGAYWKSTARNAINEIKRCGLSEFRSSKNNIGLSYSDNIFIDVRNTFNYGFIRRLLRKAMNIFPMSIIYESQVRLTESYAKKNITYLSEVLNLKGKVQYLIEKYNVPYSLLGECLKKSKIDNQEFSLHYLDLLEQHHNISLRINFKEAKSVFEIGGGFGANIHLLLENYKNIRKVLYLDIPPNLYVGTQYLKAFYGDAVVDYKTLRNNTTIKFSPNDKLEIFCIMPHQIERFNSEIDIFMNSHSFVEMPKNVVKNYVDNFYKFPNSKNAAIALTTYDCFDLTTTFHPNELPKFFDKRKFDYFEECGLLESASKNLYFISAEKLSIGSEVS